MAKRIPRLLHPAPDTAHDTLNVRGIDFMAAVKIKAGAAARRLTIGEFLARLIAFHEAARGLADSGKHPLIAAELKKLGLETVNV